MTSSHNDKPESSKARSLDKVCQDYIDGKASKAEVEVALGHEEVTPTEGQTEHDARMQRLLEVMGPEKYNEFVHA